MKKIVKIIVMMLAVFSIVFSNERDPREEELTYLIGEKVDNFEVTSLDGTKTISLDDLKGKKVFLNFTTTWCPDCIKEKEILGPEYAEKYKDSNVEFIIVFGPYKSDNKEKVEEYMKKNGYTFTAYYDTEGKELYNQFGVVNIPTTFFINEEGVLEDVNVESGYKEMKYFK
ncbi:TlpA family protein disulfide reductase [Cetobacterium somerae]|uniref:TlpA disulfide reductase family protein n=1 Tax=Cetobacterium sp. NK01 TaxID=2993530 RepID=UPI0021169DA5|nr:TlpA disulfide reductase family protein [Cetobacterium sp. NK01]MCQ8212236.1 TlpA family protein disulfide reductase [Cetobacterium sp. NK01]